jgi:hypothetical protein
MYDTIYATMLVVVEVVAESTTNSATCARLPRRRLHPLPQEWPGHAAACG